MNRDQYLAKREWSVEKRKNPASGTGAPAACRLGLDHCRCNGSECLCALICERFLRKFAAAVPSA